MFITKQDKVEWFINDTGPPFILGVYLKGQNRLKSNTFTERSSPKWDENISLQRKKVPSLQNLIQNPLKLYRDKDTHAEYYVQSASRGQ